MDEAVEAKNASTERPIRLFMSYRRTDNPDFVGRFYDRLLGEFGDENVFRDLDSLHAGSNFSAAIRREIGQVDAVVAMVGPTWAARLSEPGDFVTMEISEALKAGHALIPVRIEATPLPAREDLPDEIQGLLDFNAVAVRSDPDFRRDVAHVLAGIRAAAEEVRRYRAEGAALAERRAQEAARSDQATELAEAERIENERLQRLAQLARVREEHEAELRRLEADAEARRVRTIRDAVEAAAREEADAADAVRKARERADVLRQTWALTGEDQREVRPAIAQLEAAAVPAADGTSAKTLVLRLEGGGSAVEWSPDGLLLAACYSKGFLRTSSGAHIWGAVAGQEIHHLVHSGLVRSVAWLREGPYLATCSQDGTVCIWNPTTGERIHQVKLAATLVVSVAWSPYGHQLATTFYQSTITKLWDAFTGQQVRDFEISDRAEAVAWSPDGKHLAIGHSDKTDVYDVTTGLRALQHSSGSRRSISSVAWSPDGKQLATGSTDKTVRIWNAITAEQTHQLHGHAQSVDAVAWSPDGRRLATGSSDKTVRIWNPATRQQTILLNDHTHMVSAVTWSPDGKHVASTGQDRTVRIWDASAV